MTTDRQKAAVSFCERWLGIKYQGNIECYQTVSYFIGQHIAAAKERARLATLDYIFANKPF